MLRRTIFAVALVVGILLPSLCPGSQRDGGVEVHRLSNGLTAILLEDHSSAVVSIQYWVHAGSRTEDPSVAGITHLIEHMIFKGTPTMAAGELASAIESSGGDINAYTTYDYTVYHVTIASRFAPLGLQVLTDAIQNAIFDPAELEREKKVVIEELRMRMDRPWAKMHKALWAEAFRRHPYGRPIIGYEQTVKAISREDVLRYFRDLYVPSNMVLVIVGDFDSQTMLRDVRRLWKGIQGRPAREPSIPQEPPQEDIRLVVLKEQATEAYLHLSFRIPPAFHPDAPALDILAFVLGSGRSSRLFKTLRIEKELVRSIDAYAFTPQDQGLFLIQSTLAPKDIRRAYKEIWKEIFKLHSSPPDLGELQKAKTATEAQFLFSKETMQGKARTLGYFQMLFGSIEEEKRYLRAIRALRPPDIQNVARKYLKPRLLTAGILLPNTSQARITKEELLSLAEEARREIQTTSTRKTTLRPSQPVFKEILPSGMRLLIRAQPNTGTVALQMVFLGGSRLESRKNAGISGFLARMLTQGTISRDTKEIAEAIESLGGELDAYSGRNSTGVSAQFLSRFLPQAVELMADVVMNPSFEKAALERQRRLILAAIKREKDQPMKLAFNTFTSSLFKVHPYGLRKLGTQESISSITRGDLMALHRRVFVPDNAVLCVVGDVEPGDVRRWVYRYFGKWDARAFRTPRVPKEPPIEKSRTIKVRMPFQQVHVVMGFHGTSLLSPDRYALEVLDVILSGQGGRLFRELRDRRGLAYTVGAFSAMGLDPGYFGTYIATSPKNLYEALEGIEDELKKVTIRKVGLKELQRAKKYIIGTYEIGHQSPSSKAFEMALNERYGLGYGFGREYIEKIQSVTQEDVLRVAKKYINLEKKVTVIVGPVP